MQNYLEFKLITKKYITFNYLFIIDKSSFLAYWTQISLRRKFELDKDDLLLT